jgi:hypothetical protein
VYVLVAEFIGEIGPLKLRLPATRYELEAKRQPSRGARVLVPEGRIPLHTARTPEVSDDEAQRIAASTDPRFAQYRRMPEAKRTHARAEAQLAAAIRSGNCLRAGDYEKSPLGLWWYPRVEALVKVMVGELEASRLNSRRGLESWIAYLDDLASRLATSGQQLTPSDAWDSYVERVDGFRQDLGTDISEGEAMRGEVFDAAKLDRDNAEAKVNAWLECVQETFASVPELRGLPTSPYAPGLMMGYEGLSQEQSVPVWRLYSRLDELGPVLDVIAPYVQALKGER